MAANLESVRDLLEVVPTLAPEATVSHALEVMYDADVKIVPVCSARGRVLGIVVRDDLLNVDSDVPVGVLRRIIEPITLTTSASVVARLMKRERIRSAPVVDQDGVLLGMLDAFLLSLTA